MELYPGKYKLSAILTSSYPVDILKDTRCIGYDILTWAEKECFDMDENKLDRWMNGQLTWDTPETYFMVTPDNLYSSSELVIDVLAQDLQNVPDTFTGVSKECGSISCLPGIGCLFDICNDNEIQINAKVTEDMQVVGLLGDLGRREDIRTALEPRFI